MPAGRPAPCPLCSGNGILGGQRGTEGRGRRCWPAACIALRRPLRRTALDGQSARLTSGRRAGLRTVVTWTTSCSCNANASAAADVRRRCAARSMGDGPSTNDGGVPRSSGSVNRHTAQQRSSTAQQQTGGGTGSGPVSRARANCRAARGLMLVRLAVCSAYGQSFGPRANHSGGLQQGRLLPQLRSSASSPSRTSPPAALPPLLPSFSVPKKASPPSLKQTLAPAAR
ncbi:hypothetical protein K505DRAFT_355562 [Melanomma pulvis-pyrius CBS 109.77]|uniref:Uncharacterized protein n=1 Tax=Melanomma pulvis-pyrius CBS 109.77 TaxID=1314802 RepID=A0A6A6XXX1_9PLEO|nr:hypothetical protein K505DRAFT_355562 [Melanomma pulvis-pyrius CBS 109.77]